MAKMAKMAKMAMMAKMASGTNELNMFEHASIIECKVPLYKLSSLFTEESGRVGYLKIDVEGFELAVLLGAEELIKRDRPIIQMEIEKTHNPNYKEVIQRIQQHQYHGYALEKLALDAEILNQYDFLLIPNDKINAFADLIIP